MNPGIETHGLRYLTAGGALVVIDRDIQAGLVYDHHDEDEGLRFPWRVVCYGCGWAPYTSEIGKHRARADAQEHAETCRAVPRDAVTAPDPGGFVQALTAELSAQRRAAAEKRYLNPYQASSDEFWWDYSPGLHDKIYSFSPFLGTMAALYQAIADATTDTRGRQEAEVAAQRYLQKRQSLSVEGGAR